MRLLLAEDEKEMAHALEAVFTHNHYSVDVVYNGIDAADWAESGNYDGMILDIMMKTWNASETIMDAVTSFEAPAVTKQIALHAAERYCRRTPYGRGCRKNPPARFSSCG